jgi:superfamily II DNA/RNA helicase
VHRIGRTGRAGKSGLALSLVSPTEEWLLTAIEKIIGERLLQQWLPGYEPNLDTVDSPKKTENKRKTRKNALKNSSSKSRHRR